ncbi:Hypothetical protein UVM_LOCUS46 [uncultured virus]|nr:Hypothetical protein UVM_LOCUS46 [uncultured virus]
MRAAKRPLQRSSFPDCELRVRSLLDNEDAEAGEDTVVRCHRVVLATIPYFRCLLEKTPPRAIHGSGVELWGTFDVRVPFARATFLYLIDRLYDADRDGADGADGAEVGDLLTACAFLALEPRQVASILGRILRQLFVLDPPDSSVVRELLCAVVQAELDPALQRSLVARLSGYVSPRPPLCEHDEPVWGKLFPDDERWVGLVPLVSANEILLGRDTRSSLPGIWASAVWNDLTFSCYYEIEESNFVQFHLNCVPSGEQTPQADVPVLMPDRFAHVTLTTFEPLQPSKTHGVRVRAARSRADVRDFNDDGACLFPPRLLGGLFEGFRRAAYVASCTCVDYEKLAFQFRIRFVDRQTSKPAFDVTDITGSGRRTQEPDAGHWCRTRVHGGGCSRG